MIRPVAIDHICLWVRSLQESRDYYESLFNVECKPREGDNRSLVVESAEIHFFISEDSSLPDDYYSRQHLSFQVSALADVIRHLELLGITDYNTGEITFMQHHNYKWCEWRDPNNIRLECVELT